MSMTDWNKWHHRYLTLAQHVAAWSHDPSTKTGCVIARSDRTIAAMGYNGFPRGVNDDYTRYEDRPTKYGMVVHAEVNAILSAHGSVHGCTLYCSLAPCSSCAGAIIQAGIDRVVSVEATPSQLERWGDSFNHTQTMFREAGVRFDTVPARWVDE